MLNRIIISGNLTRDPEGRRTNSGTSVCNFGVANNRGDKALFLDVTSWGQTADYCRDYLRKGNSVTIDGRLEMDEWQDRNTGQKRTKLKLVAENIQNHTPRVQTEPTQSPPEQQPEWPPPSPFPMEQPEQPDESVDDLPFDKDDLPYDGIPF